MRIAWEKQVSIITYWDAWLRDIGIIANGREFRDNISIATIGKWQPYLGTNTICLPTSEGKSFRQFNPTNVGRTYYGTVYNIIIVGPEVLFSGEY